ncbi:imelysin family protein [Ulvibacter litoralis]|uniref:Putative iron-regulated protein n=1 Tax=Ulvibacter litoralis TaxID=227084 RepID=A0A1G7CIQ5_9FLAO|nr:imelysin family protein [Ulvibacter litoralis]GHC47208.1 lipoprotein precursor [Ulvibacter litoralis]SDE39217.1 putative iron-regulated protein [Ulvibacter litoralis]
MKKIVFPILITITTALFVGCSSDDDSGTTDPNLVTKQEVVENYAAIVYQNYVDAYSDAVALQTSLATFTATPTEANHNAAKQAWKTARESYGTTEAFRFAAGPIDDSDGPEGLLNAWPLDENYIDYVEGASDTGIINNVGAYPAITKELLVSLNEEGGETNISVGYHAIEFLLWGQDNTDPEDNQAGLRPYTDFVDGGTAQNQDRRRDYVTACASLLLDHLQLMIDEWAVGGPYRTTFLALNEDVAIKNILTGIATLSKSELAGERMFVALSNQDQEDEHSCFSDNTHRDIRLNLEGIKNVYIGTYGSISGASLSDLVTQANATTALEVTAQLNEAVTTVEATGIPFDIAISGGSTTTEGAKVLQAVNALQDLGDQFVLAGSALGVTVVAD